MSTRHHYRTYSSKTPKAEKLSKKKHYTVANPCPECGNDNGDKMVRLRAGLIECSACGTTFTTDEI